MKKKIPNYEIVEPIDTLLVNPEIVIINKASQPINIIEYQLKTSLDNKLLTKPLK